MEEPTQGKEWIVLIHRTEIQGSWQVPNARRAVSTVSSPQVAGKTWGALKISPSALFGYCLTSTVHRGQEGPRVNISSSTPQSPESLSRNPQWFKAKLPRPALKFIWVPHLGQASLPLALCKTSALSCSAFPTLLRAVRWKRPARAEMEEKESRGGSEWAPRPAPAPPTSTLFKVLRKVIDSWQPTRFMKYALPPCNSSSDSLKAHGNYPISGMKSYIF